MNQVSMKILELEEDLRDTLENELISQQRENKKVLIKDIKYVGQIDSKDKVNGNKLLENLFIAEKEISEIDSNGSKRTTDSKVYYLNDKCIGGKFGDNQIVFKEEFALSEPDKADRIKELIGSKSKEELDKNSLSNLKEEEISEVLTAYLGKKVQKEEVEKTLQEIDEDDVSKLEKEQKELEKSDENDLSEKQTEKIKVNGIQKVDLNRLIDGKETLGKRLDLDEYETLHVIYSERVNEVTAGSKINNTTYSLVGIKSNGDAKVLNDEFVIDSSVGNSGMKEQTKIRANSTATRDNNDLSVYTRKSNGASIGCENDMGNVNMFFYQKTIEENENVGIQIETSQTPVIPIETREVLNRNNGEYQRDNIKSEVESHTDKECIPDNVKDFDGNENTSEHLHIDRDDYIPNTRITWQEFMNRCGYRGEGDLETAVEKINEMPVVNQDTVEEFIQEQEEEYALEEPNHDHKHN